jgi:hypothetical protein
MDELGVEERRVQASRGGNGNRDVGGIWQHIARGE